MSQEFEIDNRSLKNIEGLLPEVRSLAVQLLKKASKEGVEAKVLSGLRTFEEQDEIYARGRTKPGVIVTTKPGGYSNHNFGLAFDLGVFQGTEYIEEGADYAKLGNIGESLGLVWGGNWKEFTDEPHFELRPKWSEGLDSDEYLAQLRERHEQNQALLT